MDVQKQVDDSNVVSIFAAKAKEQTQNQAQAQAVESTKDAYEIFMEAMQRNKQNRDRLQKERNKANRGVLKSYQIKD